MRTILTKSILLLAFAVVVCCVIYPAVLLAIGQVVFPFQANGSLVRGPDGSIVGSRLIAQPFTRDEYFQPRPSAASYDASSSSSSALAPSNYALRDRVARQLGPLVRYRGGPKSGAPVSPDIQQWFANDTFQGKAHLVAQWADLHNGLAQAWVTADPTHGAYVDNWAKTHGAAVSQFVKDNPATPQPKAADLAVAFFKSFSEENPGKFPGAASQSSGVATITPVAGGDDIPSLFFDLWRQDHPAVDLQDVPADMVTTSGSGLDPHISLQNAMLQLGRIAPKWAADLSRDSVSVEKEIEAMVRKNARAPLGGVLGEPFVNVLEINLDLLQRYGAPPASQPSH
jgi:K+-transporting ATPase ATPase C chain